MDNDSLSVDKNTTKQDGIEQSSIEIFSPEERAEINARIEAASARNAVTAPGLPTKQEAAKRDFFPFLINTGALLLLASGILLLFNLRQADAGEIRESAAVLGLTERALIKEIRSEANSLLGEKDTAIGAMQNRIKEVDGELKRLEALESLSDEQQRAMEELKVEQETYRENLVRLQIDKAKILTDARIREAEAAQRETRLRGQIEEQRNIIEGLSAEGRAEIESARNELASLSGEAEKTTLIEKQLAGFYANISRHMENRAFTEAAAGIAALKEYLETPSFSLLKGIRARRGSDAAAVAALSALLSDAEKRNGAFPVRVEAEAPPPDTSEEDALRRQVAEQAESIGRQTASIAELQNSVSALQAQNNGFLQNLEERDSQLEDLKAQNASYVQTIETLQKTISNVNAALEHSE